MRLISSLIFSLLVLSSFSQEKKNPEDVKLYYRSTISGGIGLHSHGYTADFRYGKYTSGFSQTIFAAELATMRHPKEYKSFNPYFEDARGYFYGKQHSLAILRTLFMQQRVINGKELKKGVAVSYIYGFGPSFGFLKPVYLEVAYSAVDNQPTPVASSSYDYIETEVFDPKKHNPDNIFGRASFFQGLDELGMLFGGHAKLALNFEYAPEDNLLRALEVGTNVDLFNRKAPLMGTAENNQLFLTFYVSLRFGTKEL